MTSLRHLVLAAVSALALSAPARAAVPYHTELPAVARSPKVRAARDARVKAYHAKAIAKARAGTLGVKTPAEQAEEARMQRELVRALEGNMTDKGILVIFEGQDDSGKSSTIRTVKAALQKLAKTNQMHFGAPPADAELIHWVKRYFAGLPKKGTVMLLDRSWYGRAVYDPYYGMADKKLRKQTLREIRHLEGLLGDKIKIVKIFVDASKDRRAKTIAKREVLAPERLGESDYLTYRDHDQVDKLYRKAIDATDRSKVPWHVVPMDDRQEGHAKVFQILARELVK